MARVWVSGDFEGWYRGTRAEAAPGSQEKRVYALRLYKGFLDAPAIVEPPPSEDGLFDVPHTFRQSELQTTIRNAAKTFTLNDLRIHDWRTAYQTDHQGEVFGTILGTACGWIDDGRTPPTVPAPPEPVVAVGRIAVEPEPVTMSPPLLGSTPEPSQAISPPQSSPKRPSLRGISPPQFGSTHEPLQASAGCAMTLVLMFVGLVALALHSPAAFVLVLLVGFLILTVGFVVFSVS